MSKRCEACGCELVDQECPWCGTEPDDRGQGEADSAGAASLTGADAPPGPNTELLAELTQLAEDYRLGRDAGPTRQQALLRRTIRALRSLGWQLTVEQEARYRWSTVAKNARWENGCLRSELVEARDAVPPGRADWMYDRELDYYIPCCSQLRGRRRCGNGPLTGSAVQSGDCGEDHRVISSMDGNHISTPTATPGDLYVDVRSELNRAFGYDGQDDAQGDFLHDLTERVLALAARAVTSPVLWSGDTYEFVDEHEGPADCSAVPFALLPVPPGTEIAVISLGSAAEEETVTVSHPSTEPRGAAPELRIAARDAATEIMQIAARLARREIVAADDEINDRTDANIVALANRLSAVYIRLRRAAVTALTSGSAVEKGESFYAIRRTDGEEMHGEYSWSVVGGPDDWDPAEEDSFDFLDPVEFELVRMVVSPVARRMLPEPATEEDDSDG